MAADPKFRATNFNARVGTASPWILLSALLLAPVLQAQTSAPASPPAPCTNPCPDAPADSKQPSTVQQFPYPGDKTKASPKPPSASTDPDAPAPAPDANPAKQFPYPGDKTKAADPDANPAKQFPYPGDSKNSGSSSSSSSSDPAPDPDNPTSTTDPDDPAASVEQSHRRKLPKVRNLQSDDEREAEDLTVARYYRNTGNWNAAYLRSKDAVKLKPDDPDAHLLLAEAAHKLNKHDEAVAEYSALLKLDASDDQVKTARKALDHLQ
ncbi:tetratricopeptide repeat protein [Granulicella sp. dw_53]|uniref:tetratricopeptide repeat protein n=1 Tax=Granulicella sp. dw_53 TaxID=2719792 RepID=UPI001BD3D25B|nr:tetratricopeptide repeat protein [Granulicella sp. dw_53]